MAIAHVGTATNTATAATSISGTLPGGILSGHVLVAQVTRIYTGGSAGIGTPAGWTSAGSSGVDSATSSHYFVEQAVFYKVATGSESAPSFTFSTSTAVTSVITARSGVNTTTPIDAAIQHTTSSTNGNTHVAPAVTTVTANALVLRFYSAIGYASSTAFTWSATPAGHTQRANVGLADSSGGRYHRSLNMDASQSSAGSSGTATATTSSTFIYSVSSTLALRPIVNIAPTANFTYIPTNLSVAFTDTSSDPDGTIASRSWNFGDGNTSTSANPTHVYTTSGNYTVTLTVTDNLGATDSEVKTVTANTAPTANFTYVPTNLLVAFTDTSSDPDGTIASRSWTFGDGASSTATNPSHAYSAAGSYVVTLTVTDNLGGTDSESKTVVVTTAAPPPDITQGTGNSYLWKIFPKRTSTLTTGMDATQTTIPLADTTYWPQGGSVIVENEIITYSGKSVINGAGNLTGVQRGQSGTTAATHSSGVEVGLLGRHSLGLLSKHKIPTFPANGAITLNEQGRWQDKDWFVRCDFANYRELAELSIYAAPSSSGNVSTTLDEGGSAVTRPTTVTAAKEKRSLTINAAPTANGDATITLASVAKTISLTAGTFEKVQVVVTGTVGSSADSFSVSYINSGGTQASVSLSAPGGTTASAYAAIIAGASYSGWTTSRTGSTVVWTRNVAEPVANVSGYTHAVELLNTAPSTPMTTIAEGATGLTAIGVADLIRITSFPGWVTGGTAGTATVTIEAIEAGPKTGTFSYSAGTTGATSTSGLTQTTAGSATSTAAVATAIRTTYSGNTYWSAGGTGANVTFTALSDGAKQDATFSPGTTGTGGLMTTTRQGLPSVVAHIRDSAGVDETRLIMANIATTTAFNIETSVSGAGTDKAVVSIFGSFGTDALSLLWRKTKVDLSDHQAGYAAYGVVREFGSGITWDSHSDEVEPTSQAKVFHHDHTETGELIGQARYYGRLDILQATNDLYVQGLSIPVIPGEEVVMAVKLRYENVPTELPAKPLFVTAHHADGTVTDLRDVTGTTGISGTASWNEPTPYTFTVPTSPSPCYEIRVASRDMSTGFILWQQLVVSGGTLPKRTYYYATNGTVTVSYDGRTPQETDAMQLGRQRVALETQYEEPAGTLTSEQYRSADDPDSFDATWYPDPADVLDRPVVEAEITLEGDGLSTPELLSGYPRFEYKLQVGLNPQPVLLKPDGTEFPGGVTLDKREEWHPNTGIDVRVLPSGRVRRGKTHEPVGYIPKLSLWAFRPEAVKYLMEKWGTEELIADWVDDEVLTLKLLSSPEFERQHGTKDGPNGRAAEWKSKEIAAEVVSVRKRIS